MEASKQQQTVAISQIPPEVRLQMLWKAVKQRTYVSPLLTARGRLLRAVFRASISMPVLTIYTRDRVEAEMLARKRASDNLQSYSKTMGEVILSTAT